METRGDWNSAGEIQIPKGYIDGDKQNFVGGKGKARNNLCMVREWTKDLTWKTYQSKTFLGKNNHQQGKTLTPIGEEYYLPSSEW